MSALQSSPPSCKANTELNVSPLARNQINLKASKDRPIKPKKLTTYNPSESTSRRQCKPVPSKLLTSYYRPANPSISTSISKSFQERFESMSEIGALEKQIQVKEAEKQVMMVRKCELENEINQVETEAQRYRKRFKSIISQNLQKLYVHKRKEKLRQRRDLGYVDENKVQDFIEGADFVNIRRKLEELNKFIVELENQSLLGQAGQDGVLQFRIQHVRKEKQLLTKELQRLEEQKRVHMVNLNLYRLEEKCKFATQNWPVIKDRYVTLQLLGKGGFSEVYKCFDLEKMEEVAVKLSFTNQSMSGPSRQEFMKHITRQYKIQKELKHSNIAALSEVIDMDDRWTVATVLELCSGPELSDYMKKNKGIQEGEARMIIKQILLALEYMYKSKVIHYDLKPRNILFHKGEIKVVDFGLSKILESNETKMDLTSQGVGTYWYLPPETFQNNPKISAKVDIWSVGVIFYQLLYGKRPFGDGMSQNKIARDRIILDSQKVHFPQDPPNKPISQQAKDFIGRCLQYNQDSRISIQQASVCQYMSLI